MGTVELEQARGLALAIGSAIARHCRSASAPDWSHKAATLLGALSAGQASRRDGMAAAEQLAEELFSQSCVCPNRQHCGVNPLANQLSTLLLDHGR